MWTTLLRPSWRLGINSLAGRRVRTALLIAAVSLAASLVVAVATCIESMQGSIESRLLSTLGAADARIIHLFQGRFDDELLDEVRTWPEVDRAIGRSSGSLTLVRSDGRLDDDGLPLRITPRAHGIDPSGEYEVRPIELNDGVYPTLPDEILIDSFVAEKLQVGLGDQLEVQRFGDPVRFRVVGIYGRPMLGLLQRPQVQVLRVAFEEAVERQGQLSDIAIQLDEDQDLDAFCERYIDGLPDQLSLEPAELARTGFDRRLVAVDIMFILSSVFAFLCCSYIIIIGMTTGVTERQRELAITRCVGATRLQVFSSQLVVGGIVGTIGACLGVPIGIGLAAILVWYFREMLESGLVIGWMGIFLAVIGSIGAGLVGALWPAIAASRVSPLQAVAVSAKPARRATTLIFLAIAVFAIGLQLAFLLPNDEQVRFWLFVLAGLPLIQTAYFLLAIPVFVLITLLLGRWLGRLLRLPANLLPQSALAIPYRLGLTAGALTIGIALLVSTWSSTASLLDGWLGKMTFADGFAFSRNGISREARDRIDELPFVRDTCPISYLPLQVRNKHIFGVEGLAPPNVICIGFEPELFFQVNQVQWSAGTPEEAIPLVTSGEGILVAEEFLATRGIAMGDTLELGAGRVSKEYKIVGVISAAGLDVATQLFGIRSAYHEHALSCIFADFDSMATQFDNPDVYVVQINLTDDIDDEAARIELSKAVPGVLFVSGRWIKRTLDELGNIMLLVNSALAFAALALACLAVGNVLIANVASRQFEYGVLRAVGATRGHLMRLVYGEAILLVITAAIVGTVFGMHAAWMDHTMRRDLIGLDFPPSMPWGAAGVGYVVLLFMTLLAATPAGLRLLRKTPRELLSAGRGGA